MAKQFPTSYEAARSAAIHFLKACDPHIQKLHDRQLLRDTIDRLTGGSGTLGTGLKNTGIKRPVDSLGRIVVPKEMRATYGLETGEFVEFYVDPDAGVIYLQKHQPEKCAICGYDKSLTEIKQKHICEDCISKLFEGGDSEL